MTLSVGGAVISGVLTSERVYFESLTRALETVIGRVESREHHEGGADVARERSGVDEGGPGSRSRLRQSGRLGLPKRSASMLSAATTGAKEKRRAISTCGT
jgi:hypothetical protein